MLTKCMKQSRAKGFTLTEVVLAIGVVAVLIVVFMAMFIPARRTTKKFTLPLYDSKANNATSHQKRNNYIFLFLLP